MARGRGAWLGLPSSELVNRAQNGPDAILAPPEPMDVTSVAPPTGSASATGKAWDEQTLMSLVSDGQSSDIPGRSSDLSQTQTEIQYSASDNSPLPPDDGVDSHDRLPSPLFPMNSTLTRNVSFPVLVDGVQAQSKDSLVDLESTGDDFDFLICPYMNTSVNFISIIYD